jgi:hypothetical protein
MNPRKLLLVAGLAALLPGLPQAQYRVSSETPPPQGAGGKTIAACTADTHRFCASAALQQECLVKHWDDISEACQDALSSPLHGK